MNMKKEPFKLKPELLTSLTLGILLSISSIATLGGPYFIVSLFDFNFSEFVKGIGVIALYSCIVFLFAPILGLILALIDKSWNMLFRWSVGTIIAIGINALMASILL